MGLCESRGIIRRSPGRPDQQVDGLAAFSSPTWCYPPAEACSRLQRSTPPSLVMPGLPTQAEWYNHSEPMRKEAFAAENALDLKSPESEWFILPGGQDLDLALVCQK